MSDDYYERQWAGLGHEPGPRLRGAFYFGHDAWDDVVREEQQVASEQKED